MKTTKKITIGTGKVTIAILGCILMPVLIWVGLGTAVYQQHAQKQAQTGTTQTLGQILATAGFKKK